MERRGSLAQGTRRRFTNAYERLEQRHTSQDLLQDQRRQEDQQQEQQRRENEQQEQQNERRPRNLLRRRQREVQDNHEALERRDIVFEDRGTQTTRVVTQHDTGTQTLQAPSYRDASAQTEQTLIYYDASTQTEPNPTYDDVGAQIEVASIVEDQSNTNEEFDKDVHAVEVDATTVGTIHSQAVQNPGKFAVSADSVTGLPLLLLTHRSVFVMNQIRSKGQLVEVLVENTTKSVQEVQARREIISGLENELENDDTSDERKAILRQEIADAEAILEEHRQEMFRIDDDQERENRDLQVMREEFLATLEQALSDAKILEPKPERVSTTKDKEQEDTNAEQASQDSQASVHTVASAGELQRQAENEAVLDDLKDARTYLHKMEEQFEDRAGMYKRHLESYKQAVEAGITSMTMTEFDCNYIQNVSNLTRCLRDAEEDYEAAVAEAQRLNLLSNDEQRSNLASRPSDGYRTSFEADLVSTAPVDLIESWRDSAVETQNLKSAATGADKHTEQPEIDYWEAETIHSSQSSDAQEQERRLMAVDRNPDPFYRNRIDRWHEEMDQWRTEWINSHSPAKSSDASD